MNINETNEQLVLADILSKQADEAFESLRQAVERDKYLEIERDFLSDHKNWSSCILIR